MSGFIEFIILAPFIIKAVIAVLALLVILFTIFFVTPAVMSWARLAGIVRGLKSINGRPELYLESLFSVDKTFSHLWREYRDTLHSQQEYDPNGRNNVSILRSTIPASMVFTDVVIVDTRLGTEFFKHLPGLFTGVGIIGTFWGLIGGLQAFQVSADANVVRGSLEGLMHRVSDAFLVSATAILFAMVATFIEKLLVTILYGKVEEITARLDSFFAAGAGEEYLARLTRASEDSAAQSKILKDALVTDLERILTAVTDRQIEAQRNGFENLGKDIPESIKIVLEGPLDDLKNATKKNSEGNTLAVTQLLTDVLAGFSQKLEQLFGGQISGINDLQQKTIQALGIAVDKMNEMAKAIETSGAKSADAMNERLIAAITSMDAHQKHMNERMAAFVTQLRSVVDDTQAETNRKLQATLIEIGEAARAQIAALEAQRGDADKRQTDRENHLSARTQETLRLLGERVGDILSAIKKHTDENADNQTKREESLAQHTTRTIDKLSSVAETLMAEVQIVMREVRSATDSMRSITTDAVGKMSSGAETLYLAASEFTSAGQSVSGALQQASGLAGKLQESAGSVSTASAALQGVVVDHGRARETFALMVRDLKGIVENAKNEAALTSDVLARIESASKSLGTAQIQAKDYLDGVSKILTDSHSIYASSLKTALQEQYQEFYSRLSQATALLRQAIEELAVTVQPTPRGK